MTTKQANRRPCKVISLKEKLAILKQFEAGSSRREIEKMFKCSQSTISRILVSKDSILQEARDNVNGKRENLTANNHAYKDLYQALSQWAQEMKLSNGMITANVAREKAKELSRAMGQELKPSKAWLYRWKERENIIFAKRPKDPAQILREFLDKQDKRQHQHFQNYKEVTKMPKLVGKESRLHIPGTLKASETDIRQAQKLNDMEESCNKPRTKREYIKRLPIIDASGMIYRSRKEKTFLTLLQKLEILQRLKNGERRPDLIIEYKLSQSAMSQIVADEEKILKLAAGGQNLQMKRIRGGIFKDGEAELNAWVREKMRIGESLTRTQIKSRAKEIADRLHIDFKASTGWLEKWKARMNLDFNENQVLQRKVPTYLSNEDDSFNGLEESEQPAIVYDHLEEDEIKQEMDNHVYNDVMDDSNEDFSYDDIDDAEIKTETLTPQQFYLQTIQADLLAAQNRKEQEKEEHIKERKAEDIEEESDIKPYIGTPPRIESEPQTKDTLHEQVLNWLNRYKISPIAATELLNILQSHLHLAINTTNTNTTTED